MLGVNVLCHLWDLVDEGIDAALDVLQGRIGVGGIAVPVSAGATRHLRFMAGVSPRWFTSRGGVFFQPERGRYANTRCAPVMSDWLKGRNPLARVAEACRQRGLALRAVVECIEMGRLAERYPFAARKNVFGDLAGSQICLVNPDVAELIRALSGDVRANYGIDTIELCGLDAMWPPRPDASTEIGLGARQLMALCFCESCRQSALAAGVDVDAAARSTTVRLDKLFRTGRPIESSLAAQAADDPPLSSFLAWYRDRVGELFRSVTDRCECRIISRTRSVRQPEELGIDGVYSQGAHAVACDFAGWETEPLAAIVQRATALVKPGSDVELHLRLERYFASEPQALVRNLTRAAELGAASANLDCYGHIPAEGVEVVKQAARFARRTTAES